MLGALLLGELAGAWIEDRLIDLDRQGRRRIRSARARTLLTVGRKAVTIVVLTIAVLLVLAELGANIGPLRCVRLRDLAGTVHTIPFSAIDTVSSLTKDYSYYVFDVNVGYGEDVDRVCTVLREIDEELRADRDFGPLILEPLEILGVDQFADSAVVVKARTKTQPIQQWSVGREFNKRLKQRFDALGIEIPFPQRTVHVRAPAGTPPDAIRAAAAGGEEARGGAMPVPAR